MPGYLRVPRLTGTLSAAAPDRLRSCCGFCAVVISDALEMRAVSGPFGLSGAAARAVAAETDLPCLGRDVREEGYLEVRKALAEEARSGCFLAPGLRLPLRG